MKFNKGDLVLIDWHELFQVGYIDYATDIVLKVETEIDGLNQSIWCPLIWLTLIEPFVPEPEEPLFITPEIRKLFREREMNRVEGFKNEIKQLQEKIRRLEQDVMVKNSYSIRIKNELRKLLDI